MNLFFSRLSTGLALCFGLLTLNAQKADAQSQKILDAVANNYKFKKNTYFKFLYGTGNNGKVTKTQTGIFYSTPSQFKLKIMGIEQIFDGNKIYNISDDDKEVTIAKAGADDAMFSPTNYLNTYKKEYNTTYVGKRTVKGSTTDLIKMIPIKKNGITSVYLYINTAKKQIAKIEQYSDDKSVAVISISDYKENQKLNPELFTFNKNNYKNYIITEL